MDYVDFLYSFIILHLPASASFLLQDYDYFLMYWVVWFLFVFVSPPPAWANCMCLCLFLQRTLGHGNAWTTASWGRLVMEIAGALSPSLCWRSSTKSQCTQGTNRLRPTSLIKVEEYMGFHSLQQRCHFSYFSRISYFLMISVENLKILM